MYTRICDECGQAFTTRYKHQRFCKRQHFRVCEICKNEFEVKSLPCDTRTCSKKCAAEKARKDGTLQRGREKAKQTMLERYGVEHPLQNPEFLARSKSTLQQHYGVTNPLQSNEIKRRVATTVLSKYGTDNVSKSDEVKQKIEETFQTKYGVKNAMQVPEFVDKQRASTKASCGKPFALQSDSGKAKLRRSLKDKYGVDTSSCFGISSVRDKAKATIQDTYGTSFISQTNYWHERVPDTTFNHFEVNWPCMTEQCRCATDVISKPNKQFGALLTNLRLEFEYEKSIGYYLIRRKTPGFSHGECQQYNGPVYRFQDYVGDFKMETLASSKSEAKRNFQYRIKQQLDLVRNAKIALDDACIVKVEN